MTLSVCLSVPDSLDVGDCLVGGVKVARFTVSNHGGPGRFVLMATSSWPCSSAMVMLTSTHNSSTGAEIWGDMSPNNLVGDAVGNVAQYLACYYIVNSIFVF